MIQIEFVHYTETKNGSSYLTITGIKSLKIDPQKISGIDYYSVESRKAKFTFYSDTSFMDSYFIEHFVFIPDTKYNIFAVRIKHDGVIEYIGYIKPANVTYDEKTKLMTISCTDIIGVLLDIGKVEKDYAGNPYIINDILENEITDILNVFDVNYIDNSTNVIYSVNNLEFINDKIEEFEQIEGYTLDILPMRLKARIRNVERLGIYFKVSICDYISLYNAVTGKWDQEITYIIIIFRNDLLPYGYQYKHETLSGSSMESLWLDWWEDGGGNECNSSASGGGITITFGTGDDGTRFYATGDVTIEEIIVSKENDNNNLVKYTKDRIEFIGALLILKNCALKIAKNGDITIENKDLIDEANAINIDGYVLENSNGFILHSKGNFNKYDFVWRGDNIEGILHQFYDNYFESFKFEIAPNVRSDIELELGNTIIKNGAYRKIVEIDEPYNENIYYIKAWGE